MTRVVWRDRPIVGRPKIVEMTHGRKIETLVREAIDEHGLGDDFWVCGQVRINDVVVPRQEWGRVAPRCRRDRDVVVTFHHVVGDLGSSGNLWAALAMVAVLVAAVVVAPYLAGLIVPAGFAPTTATIGLVQAGLIGIGSLAVHALTPPPAIPQESTPTSPKDQSGRAASVSGNSLAPGATVPFVVGGRRVYPPLAGEPTLDIVDGDQVIKAVYVLTGRHALSDLRLQDSLEDDLEDLVAELQEGGPGGGIQSLVQEYGVSSSINLTLSQHKLAPNGQSLLDEASPDDDKPIFHTLTTKSHFDEFRILIVWPGGLFRSEAQQSALLNPFRLQMRLQGSSTWIKLPEIHFSRTGQGLFQRMIKLRRGSPDHTLARPPTDGGPIYAFKHVPGQTDPVFQLVTADWDADASFSAGAGNDVMSATTMATTNVRNVELLPDAAVIYLDDSVFPDGRYDVQIMQGGPQNPNEFTAATYVSSDIDLDFATTTAGVLDFFAYYHNLGSSWRVWFPQALWVYKAQIPQVCSLILDNPIQTDDFAQVAIQVTGRRAERVSVFAERYTTDWDGAGWNTVTTTRNPAPHVRDIMTSNVLNDDPIPLDLIDNDDLLDVRQFCIDNFYECNLIVDGGSARQAVDSVLSCCFSKYRACEKHGALIDRDVVGQTPVQIFSFRNMRSFKFTKGLETLPSGARLDFPDQDNDFVRTPLIVYDPLSPAPSDRRLEAVTIDGLTERSAVIERSEHDQMQLRKRMAFFSCEVPAQSINVRRGDLVGAQHDVLSAFAGSAYIKDVTVVGGNVTELLLDGSVPLPVEDAWEETAAAWTNYSAAFALPQIGVAVRDLNDGVVTMEVTGAGTESDALTLVDPIADDGSIDEGCLVVSGRLGDEYSRFKVFNIEATNDMMARMTFVAEAPELFDPPSARQVADRLGLGSDLVLCLDAGARASYRDDGSLYDLSDLKNHFYLGATADAESTDPTFVGTINKRSMLDYLLFDGGDFMDEVSNGSWDVSFHKDGALWTMVFVVYYAGGDLRILTNRSAFSDVGCALLVNSGTLIVRRSNGFANQDVNLGAVSSSAWHFIGVSLNENGGAAGSHYRIDGATATFNGSATSPSSSSPASKARIFGNPSGTSPAPSGSRFMAANVYGRNLTTQELTDIYDMWLDKRLGT